MTCSFLTCWFLTIPSFFFLHLSSFIKWRVALMELSLRYLELEKATEPIPDYETGLDDPYRGIQVHDYDTLSIIRQDSYVKAASKKTISIMTDYYPETLSRKFFVNIATPAVYLYKAMTLVLPKTITSKFVLCASGRSLAEHLKGFEATLPAQYGGTNAGALDALTSQLKLDNSRAEAEAAADAAEQARKAEYEKKEIVPEAKGKETVVEPAAAAAAPEKSAEPAVVVDKAAVSDDAPSAVAPSDVAVAGVTPAVATPVEPASDTKPVEAAVEALKVTDDAEPATKPAAV